MFGLIWLPSPSQETGYETLKPSNARTMLYVAIDVELTVAMHNLLFSLCTGSQISCVYFNRKI